MAPPLALGRWTRAVSVVVAATVAVAMAAGAVAAEETAATASTTKGTASGGASAGETLGEAAVRRKVIPTGGRRWPDIALRRSASADPRHAAREHWPYEHISADHRWKTLSGGAEAIYHGAGQMLTGSEPWLSSRAAGWQPHGWVASSKDHLHPDKGGVRAYAVSLYDQRDEWEVKVVIAKASRAPHPRATATLPAGFSVVGGGAKVHWKGLGSLLVDSYPSGTRSWTGSAKDHLKSDPSTLTVYAIGLRRRDGKTPPIRIKQQTFERAAHPSGTVYTTPGWGLLGGGASVSKGGLGNMLVSLVPAANGRSFRAGAKDHLKSDGQRITVYLIEMKGAVQWQ